MTDSKAIGLLESTVTKSVLYKHPEDFVHAKDSSYVESFNNVMNLFQDKRICFSDEQYHMREQLAVLYWNENVDREYTSVWKPRQTNIGGKSRKTREKKNYRPATYNYCDNIWKLYVQKLSE